MAESPIIQTIKEMFERLEDALRRRGEAQKQIIEYTNAVRALAQVCEDGEIKDYYLQALDVMGGKPSFLDAIRRVLKLKPDGLAPSAIRAQIQVRGIMDFSGYSNPLASIHTTLRRMKESDPPEIEEIQKANEKIYRLVAAVDAPPSHRRRTL